MRTAPLPDALALSVTGAKHERTDRPCQDAADWATRHGAGAVAIADGHGTCARGDVGAQLAVEVAIEHLLNAADHLAGAALGLEYTEDLFRSQVRRQIVGTWQSRVDAHARALGEAVPDPNTARAYGTTRLFALWTREYLVTGQLGDGEVLLLGDDGRVRRPLPSEPLAFAGETPSLCEPRAWFRLRLTLLPRPETSGLLCLMTDGYTNAYEGDAALDEVVRGYARILDEDGPATLKRCLPDFLKRVTREGSGDDVSVAFLRWPDAHRYPDTDGETDDPLRSPE